MDVVVLGTGYRRSVLDGEQDVDGKAYRPRNDTNYILRLGSKICILDMGSGAFKHALEYLPNFDDREVDAVFITHVHPDHFSSLHDLFLDVIKDVKKGKRKKKIDFFSLPEAKAANLMINRIWHSGIDEYNEELFNNAVDFHDITTNTEFYYKDSENDPENLLSYKIKSYKVNHRDTDTYGFTFSGPEGVTVGFTADSCYCEGVEDIVKNSDFIFIDMARNDGTRKDKLYSHMGYEDVMMLARKYPDRTFFPIHTSDPAQNIAVELTKKFPNIQFLEDDDVLHFDERGYVLEKPKRKNPPSGLGLE